MFLAPRKAPEARIDAVNYRIKIPACPSAEVAEFQWGESSLSQGHMALAAGWKLAQSCCEIIMTYHYGIPTSCREAARNSLALLFFGSPGAAGAGAQGRSCCGWWLAWAWQPWVQGCVCSGVCVTAHSLHFFLHPAFCLLSPCTFDLLFGALRSAAETC